MRYFLLALLAVAAQVRASEEAFSWSASAPPTGGMAVAVDLTSLPADGLARSRVLLTAPRDGALVFPHWIPGTHAPSGPVANIGGLRVADAAGHALAWQRDAHDPWRIAVACPPGAALRLDLTYIANQSDVNSLGIDVEGTSASLVLNWNCCFFYPAGAWVAGLPCAVEVRMPAQWDLATALPTLRRDGDVVRFGVMPLAEVIDRPLLAAPTLRHVILRAAAAGPEVALHIAGNAPDEGVLEGLRRLPDEAAALFGGSWFARYDMLLRVGGPDLGLEHATSSLNGIGEGAFAGGDAAWALELMPHEFVHSWVGKHRRPVGMLMPDWQDPPAFDGLWVYEGLTELLGRVLAVRCGLLTPAVWRESLAHDIAMLARMPGREWRSLRDTCRCNWQLRGGSPGHQDLRRGQDFYGEGALFWLVADRQIRAASAGTHGLDDFCRAFFGPASHLAQGFSEDQLVAALAALAPQVRWQERIARCIDGVGPLDRAAILDGSGWRLDRIPVDGTDQALLERLGDETLAEASGMNMADGWIRSVAAGGAADRAGLRPGDFIYSANGIKLKDDKRALARTLVTAHGPLGSPLYVHREGVWKEYWIWLPTLPTVATLVRVEAEPDGFAALLTARVAVPAATETAAPEPHESGTQP